MSNLSMEIVVSSELVQAAHGCRVSTNNFYPGLASHNQDPQPIRQPEQQ